MGAGGDCSEAGREREDRVLGARGREAIGGRQIFWLPLVAFPLGTSSIAAAAAVVPRPRDPPGRHQKDRAASTRHADHTTLVWGLVGLVFSSRASFFPSILVSWARGAPDGPPAVAGLCSS